MDEAKVIHNSAVKRFEMVSEGKIASLQYRLQPGRIVFVHTEVPEEFEGKGVGSLLAKAGLKFAVEHNLRIVPLCPFVAGYIERHREFANFVALLDPGPT